MNEPDPINQNYVDYSTSSQGYDGEGIVKIRLDTSQLLQDIQEYITGLRTVSMQDENGQVKMMVVRDGPPLCNQRGTRDIMMLLKGLFNQHISQGNNSPDSYFFNIADFQKDLVREFVGMRDYWGMTVQNNKLVYTQIKHMTRNFMTRTINNKERESLSNYNYREIKGTNQPEKGRLFG